MTKKLPKILSVDEINQLLVACYNPHHRLQIQLMYYCGLRVSEMCSLRLQDLDLKEGIIKVVSGKGGKDRLVPIPKPLLAMIRQYLLIYPKQDKLVPTGQRNIQTALQRLGKKIGRADLHPHLLRHSYATQVLEKTNNLMLVKDLLGHSNIQTTQIYTHLTTAALKAGINEVWK
jgi:site-specific recombinase XerC